MMDSGALASMSICPAIVLMFVTVSILKGTWQRGGFSGVFA
jgi:hypothetical protein